jgi:hypothetical protein
MSFSEVLRRGDVGFQLSLPTVVSIRRDTQSTVEFTVPDLEALWWISFFPLVHLDLSEAGWPTLRRDLERQTRALFEEMFRSPEPGVSRRGKQRMRTEDPAWSPIVEVERTRVEKGCELYLLHRMFYEPGKEVVMGHVLIPVGNGLGEIRWVTSAHQTGYREAVYMHHLVRTRAPSAGDGKPHHPGQAAFDDPARDVDFPQHPLSVARAARRWLDANVPRQITASPQYRTDGEIVLEPVGCALKPPPRFVLASVTSGPGGTPVASLDRASFAGTDGIDWFFIRRIAENRRPGSRRSDTTEEEIERIARWLCASTAVGEVRSRILSDQAAGAGRTTILTLDYEAKQGPTRIVALSRGGDRGAFFGLWLMTSATLPVEAMADEVQGAAQSLRALPDGPPRPSSVRSGLPE